MAGFNLMVIPPTTFDFASMSTSKAMCIVLARRIDISGYELITPQVRLHAVNIGAAGDAINVKLASDGYAFDDPGSDFGGEGFTGQTPIERGMLINSIAISSTSTAPSYLAGTGGSNSGPGDFGNLVQIYLDVQRGTSGNANFSAKISIDLSFKSASGIQRPLRGSYLGYGARSIL